MTTEAEQTQEEFVAPWTTGITILPDVATCETFACATTGQNGNN